MKYKLLSITLLFNTLTQCSNSAFMHGPRAAIILTFFVNDIACIIKGYDVDSCFETNSKNYYAYVQNPHQWNGRIVLCDRSGVELQRLYVSYIRAIALSPREDIIMIMHEKSEGYLYGTPYQLFTTNLFRCTLSLTALSIKDRSSHTALLSWYTYKLIEECNHNRVHYREAPLDLTITKCLTRQRSYTDYISNWPDIFLARIRRMQITEDETLSVTLYDPVPLLNISKMDITPTSCTRTLTVPGQYCLEQMRSRLKKNAP